MKSFFDKLNLRPGERRLVVFVGIVVFVLLNAFFVWPQFFEWGRLKKREKDTRENLEKYQREVDRIPSYTRRLAELEKAGASVASEDQALKLATTVSSQAALSGVLITSTDPTPRTTGTTRTNQFFEEQTSSVRVTTEEKALVDFLYNLGVGNSMIRVRNMSLSPDPPQQRLVGSISLVASYAKKAPAKVGPATAPPSRTNAPANVATATAPKTNAPAAVAKAESKWLSWWPFGKNAAAGTAKTNVVARTNAPGRTNAAAKR